MYKTEIIPEAPLLSLVRFIWNTAIVMSIEVEDYSGDKNRGGLDQKYYINTSFSTTIRNMCTSNRRLKIAATI